MANYPMFQYQPQMGYGQQMQPMYQYQQPIQPVAAPQQAEQNLFCRMATSREEVLAVPVDFGGKPMTFLGPNLQTVWVKTFNPSTGGADVRQYQEISPTMPEAPKPVDFAPMDRLQALEDTVRQLADDVQQMRPQTRRRVREMEDSDHEI